MTTYKLNMLIGKNILFRLSSGKPVTGRIVDVENAGVWIQSRQFSEEIQEAEPNTPSLREPVFFVPFSGLRWVMASEEQVQS
jgi:hypothetical protein